MTIDLSTLPAVVPNWVAGKAVVSASPRRLPVHAPATGKVIAEVPLSSAADLDAIVEAATVAQRAWAHVPVKERVQVLFRFKAMLEERLDELAEVCSLENGKTLPESRASVAKGIECAEFATSLPQLVAGRVLEVSRGVECQSARHPVGVVAGITPFNFPAMVPMWLFPLAIACGNAFILKPSEMTPLCSIEMAKMMKECGLPDGVLSVVNGDREIVEAICDHPGIKGVSFVGSTKVAKLVYARAGAKGKKVRALGGAKNHLVVVPDADPEMTATNILASFTGCAGQRCMAASVVVAVGDVQPILDRVAELARAIVPGRDMGAIISPAAHQRISGYIDRAEKQGLKIVVDGRKAKSEGDPNGSFLGPTIIDGTPPEHECACDEIFGPVLNIVRVKTLDEALAIENANPYGNAAAIYTTSGGVAHYFAERANAGMIGINIGVPVPREPFAFGGWFDSKFGDGDITGEQAIDFWMNTKKITTKWSDKHRSNWMS